MVQPARGYEFGVPKEAVGVTGEGEIKIYDEDEWEKHFGKDGDKPDDIFGGDADVVGAKSKGTVLEIETDEDLIAFLDDHLFETKTSKVLGAEFGVPGWEPTVGESITMMDNYLRMFANDTQATLYLAAKGITALPVIKVAEFGASALAGYGSLLPGWVSPLSTAATGGTDALNQAAIGIMNESEVVRVYGKKYDGTYVHTDSWDYTEDEFEAEPDEEDDEGPFLADPRDWWDQAKILPATKYDFYAKTGALISYWDNWFTGMNDTLAIPGPDPGRAHPYMAWNDTLAGLAMMMDPTGTFLSLVMSILAQPRNLSVYNLAYPDATVAGGGDLVYGTYLFIRGILAGFQQLYWAIIPTKEGLLWNLLCEGLPGYTPIDDYLAKVLDLYDIDEDKAVDNVPYLLGYPVRMDVSLEGTNIEIDFEFYPEDPIDKTDPTDIDPDDTLEDFTVTFEYGEYGTQGDVIFEADGEVFFHKGGVEEIPGYEVTIILGAAALSILALIYVIMKKRKM